MLKLGDKLKSCDNRHLKVWNKGKKLESPALRVLTSLNIRLVYSESYVPRDKWRTAILLKIGIVMYRECHVDQKRIVEPAAHLYLSFYCTLSSLP